jgi:hypothetical protein
VSEAPLVRAIVQRLSQVGYVNITTPIRVATVNFEFTAVLRGTGGRALDLVILVDTTTGEFGDRDSSRVRQRIQALSRALDITKSRYVITVILAGAMLANEIELLSDTCRVLSVEMLALDSDGKPANDAAVNLLDNCIRLLLPLELPTNLNLPAEPGLGAIESLVTHLSNDVDEQLLHSLIIASNSGEDAVSRSIAEILDSQLEIDGRHV